MKFAICILILGLLMIVYAVFGMMKPSTIENISYQLDVIIGGGFLISLAIAGIIGGGK